MSEFLSSNEFWAALIGAAATMISVWLAIYFGLRKLRDTEIGRLRIKCVTDVLAYRFVLQPGLSINTDAFSAFFAALNAIPGLFGGNYVIMRRLSDFREAGAEQKIAALLLLIRETAKVTEIPFQAVTDVDLERPFSDSRITSSL